MALLYDAYNKSIKSDAPVAFGSYAHTSQIRGIGVSRWIQASSLVVSFLTFIATLGAFIAAAIYATIAQRQLKQSERPWISIDTTSGTAITVLNSVTKHPNTINFDLRYRIINTGHSPAKIFLYGRIVPKDIDPSRYDRETTGACEDAKRKVELDRREGVNDWKWTVIAQSSMILDVGYKNDLRYLPPLNFDGTSGRKLLPVNYGCILYRDADQSPIHQTPFLASLSMTQRDGAPPPIDQPIPITFGDRNSRDGKRLCIVHVLIVGLAN